MVCRDCLGRTPFASLIAVLIQLVGVGVFCVTLFKALDITLRGIFEDLFNFSVKWMEDLLIIFIAIAVAMGLYAIVLLVFGFLATGATRQKLYSGTKCIMGGRIGAAFFMVMTYIMNLIWMGITAVCTIPIMIYIILRNICKTEYKGSFEDYNFWRESDCFNLSRIGLYKNVTYGVEKNAICGEAEIGIFCEKVEDAGPMFGLALGGSFLVVIGMISFLMTLSINYTRIKATKEITEYRETVALTDN